MTLWADNDDAGRRHMMRVAAHLRAAGAEEVRVITWPAAPAKGDAADWVAAGGTAEDLAALIDAAVEAPEAAAEELAADGREEAFAASEGSAPRGRRSAADRLVELARERAELVRTADGRLYAATEDGEVFDLGTTAAREWLAELLWATEGKAPSGEALTTAITALRGFARHGREVNVYTRVAPDGADGVFIDLGRPGDRLAVHVTASGWKVVNRPDVIFFRPPRAGALPIPEPGGSLEDLLQIVNLTADDLPIAAAWLVQALLPTGPYPLLVFRGPQGSAKSTAARFFKRLVDPDGLELRSPPETERDLIIATRNARVLVFDNVSAIPARMADALCRLATGGGFGTRALYTNEEEIATEATCPVMLTGIGPFIESPDLADRTLVITLREIDPSRRALLADVEERAAELMPRLFAALLDRLAGALRELPNVQLDSMPRLADLARLAVAAERGAGEPPRFMAKFTEMADMMAFEAVEAHPAGSEILAFTHSVGRWEGTATELLAILNERVPERQRGRSWPSRARELSIAIDRLETNLGRLGVRVTRFQRHRKTKFLRLEAEGNPGGGPRPDETSGHDDPPSGGAGGAGGAEIGGLSVWIGNRKDEARREIDDPGGKTAPPAPPAPPACPSCGSVLAAPGDACPDCSNPPGADGEDPLPVVRDPGDGWKAALLAAIRQEADPEAAGAPGEASPPAPPPTVSHCADCGAEVAGSFERCLNCASRAVAAWKQRRQGGPA